MLINLIKNALKFTKEGQVTINAFYNYQKKSLVVSVIDTGVGITNEDMPRLFNKFGKLHRTAAMNSAGIGLGLTIVKQIVEQTGGSIKVSSAGPDLGSQFKFNMIMDVPESEKVSQKPSSNANGEV